VSLVVWYAVLTLLVLAAIGWYKSRQPTDRFCDMYCLNEGQPVIMAFGLLVITLASGVPTGFVLLGRGIRRSLSGARPRSAALIGLSAGVQSTLISLAATAAMVGLMVGLAGAIHALF
jgi:hypothetical protein